MSGPVRVSKHVRRAATHKPLYVRRAPVVWPKEKMTRSNGGKPLRVVMNEDSIYAYHAEPVQITSTKFEGTEARVEIEPTLSKYFTEEPVMKITKRKAWYWGREAPPGRPPEGEIEFHVDFDAGFQRGRIDIGVDELCKKSHWPKRNGAGYLKWIGLSCNDPDVKAWLGRD